MSEVGKFDSRFRLLSISSSSATFDSYASGSLRKRHILSKWVLHKFESTWEYIIITFGCTFTIQSFSMFAVINSSEEEPTLIHHIICFITVGVPLNYMKLLIGQYSQLGVILYKHICPIGHGVGYAMLLNSFIWSCYFGLTMSDFIMYLLACVDSTLNWMHCPSNSTERCWDSASNCTRNCTNETVETSAFVYWKENYMGNIDLHPTKIIIGSPIIARFIPLFFTWGLIFTFVTMEIEKYKKIIRVNFYLVSIMMVILMLVCFLTRGAGKGASMMFRINPNSILNLNAWSHAIHNVIQVLALNRACHMMYGTYMTSSMSSDILTIFSVFLNFVGTFLGGIITHATIGITMAEAGIEEDEAKYIWRNGTASYFTVLTQGIGLMGVPQLWSVIYFLTCICMIVNNLVTQVDAIEKGIADAHTGIRVYRNYMVSTICILCSLIGFIVSSKEGFVLTDYLLRCIMVKVHCFDVMVMCIFTFWIYGVQRLSDDIHFLQGSQPTKFWKIFWYIMPCVVAFPYINFVFFQNDDYGVYNMVYSLCHGLFVLPIPIFMVYEIFEYLKQHHLIGLVMPEERWGPPDPEERYLRLLFNPREEIRSRRRDNSCAHNCLLGSKILKKVVAEEKHLRLTYLYLKGDDEEDEDVENEEFEAKSNTS